MANPLKILILQNSDLRRKLFVRYFENTSGFDVDSCLTPDEAFEKLSSNNYDIFFISRGVDTETYEKNKESFSNLPLEFRPFNGESFVREKRKILKPDTLVFMDTDIISMEGLSIFYRAGVDYVFTKLEIDDKTPGLIRDIYFRQIEELKNISDEK